MENALAAAEARRVALQGNDADERRRTRRRLARYKRRLKRHGVHLLANSFFGMQNTHPYGTYTWSELHAVWQGVIRNIIDQVLKRLYEEADDAEALLLQLDAAFLRWASGFASVRGKAKARGLSALLARDTKGPWRLARVTKLDTYGLVLFFRPLVASLLDDKANAGIAYYWQWVRLARTRNVLTGEHELTESQLNEANPLMLKALDKLKPAFPDYGFETGKVHDHFHFPGLFEEHAGDTDEATGEAKHAEFKADSKASNQRNEHMQMAVRTEEREGLKMGQRMAKLRDEMLCLAVHANDLEAVRLFLQTSVPADACDAYGTPAIVLAATEGHKRCLKALLDAGAAIDARGPHNRSALTAACRNGNVKSLKLLLRVAKSVLKPAEARALMTSESNGRTPGQWALEAAAMGMQGAIECVSAMSAALGIAVSPAPPSMRVAAADRRQPSLMLPEPAPRRSLQLSELQRGSPLCRKYPFLAELRKALHLYLANKPRSHGPGHSMDAACAVTDLSRDVTLPAEVTLHPGMRFGCEPPPELRTRVLAAPTLSAKLGSSAAPHCAAFEGDDHHHYYYGIICLFFSVEFREVLHELCLVHWLVVEHAEFAGAEDADDAAAGNGDGVGNGDGDGDGGGDDEDEVLDVSDEDLSLYGSDDDEGAGELEAGPGELEDDGGPVDVGSGESEAETVEEEQADEADEAEEAEEAEADWRMPRLLYAHLPPNERDREAYERELQALRDRLEQATSEAEAALAKRALEKRIEKGCKMYKTRNFYQVKPISEALFRQGVFPEDIWDIDDPASFLLAEEAHGM